MLEFLTNVKKVESLTEADIQLLIDTAVPESKQLEYKMKLSLDDEKSKAEFLKDITSFYNSEGGVILYGLQEHKLNGGNTGTPKLPSHPGLEVQNLDKTKLLVLSCLRTGTNPPIATVYFSALLQVSGHQVLAIGIPKNHGLPSMATGKDTRTFFRRNQNQKYAMDTYELYTAFLRHHSEHREVKEFVAERTEQLLGGHFAHRKKAPKVTLHLIHIDYLQNVALDTFFAPDFPEFARMHFNSPAPDMKQEHFYGFDGLFLLAREQRAEYGDYSDGTLVFRNGIIEGAVTTVFSPWTPNCLYSGILYAHELIKRLVLYVKGAFAYYERAQINPAFYLCLNIEAPSAVSLGGPGGNIIGTISKNELNFPAFLVSGPSEVENALALILELLCQSAGSQYAPEALKESIKGSFSGS